MPQRGRLLDDPYAGQRIAIRRDLVGDLGDIVDVGLCIDPSRDGQPQQLVLGRYLGTGIRTVELDRQRLTGVYRESIQGLGDFLGRDLGPWLEEPRSPV